MESKLKIEIQQIDINHPLYQEERELRNEVLLRPIGLSDHAWEMNDTISWHFVAIQNNSVIGCVVLKPTREEEIAQLMQMAVKQDHQKKGVGKMLVKKIIEFSCNLNLKKVICHSREYAVPFYKKMGFTCFGEPYEEVGLPHINMHILLK